MDGGAGSSAKGLRAAYIWKHCKEQHSTFAVNTFMSNAAHTITHSNGQEVVHQCLSSITTVGDYKRQYVSPGCAFSKEEMLGEIEKYGVTPNHLGIHPNAVVVTQKDIDYERGIVDFEGNPRNDKNSPNLRIGSTLHGVGAARARRILRRQDSLLVRDVPEFMQFMCNTNNEIVDRLCDGESGLGEIAQGYQLSLYSNFWPKTTSRNCSVAAFLDDALLPIWVAGPIVINFRTFPIRVNNNKYVRKSDGKILTWDEFNNTPNDDREIIYGDSGGCYPDQRELTWDDISEMAGERIFECTSLTKLPRRVFTFSQLNMMEALKFNNTGDDVYISINFMNYVDMTVKEKRSLSEVLTNKVIAWLKNNVLTDKMRKFNRIYNIRLAGMFIGTGRHIDDSVFVGAKDLNSL
ncbi:MAG: hypothetical protein QXP41_00390 [Candidatus Nitrosocaldus sp.]